MVVSCCDVLKDRFQLVWLFPRQLGSILQEQKSHQAKAKVQINDGCKTALWSGPKKNIYKLMGGHKQAAQIGKLFGTLL